MQSPGPIVFRIRLSHCAFRNLAVSDFEEPRYDAFPALNLARRAGENGGVLPGILNAANEEAVQAFLQGRIPFPWIWSLVENAMEQVESFARPSLSDIMEADAKARAHVQGELEHH